MELSSVVIKLSLLSKCSSYYMVIQYIMRDICKYKRSRFKNKLSLKNFQLNCFRLGGVKCGQYYEWEIFSQKVLNVMNRNRKNCRKQNWCWSVQKRLPKLCFLDFEYELDQGSAGHIEPFFVSRGPHLGHKGYLNASKIGPRGPYVAPSCFRHLSSIFHRKERAKTKFLF